MADDPRLSEWLRAFLKAHEGVAGTVHLREGDRLVERAAVNIPPPVRAKTAVIPRGKGMAGLAWSRARPVQTCNLKEDDTGDVRPGAKAVDALGAVALPVFEEGLEGEELRAVVGIAYADARILDDPTLAALQAAARDLPS